MRRLIYTTNAIERFNRQLRKVTKAKFVFPTDDSLLKMLYLAMMDITKKWTGRRQDWSLIHAQMAIYFAERMPEQHRRGADAKGGGTVHLTLGIRPHQRYVVEKAAAGFSRLPPWINFALFAPQMVFTQNLGLPRGCRFPAPRPCSFFVLAWTIRKPFLRV